MFFTKRQFSKRYPALECAVVVIHETPLPSDHPYGVGVLNNELTERNKKPTSLMIKHRGTAAAIVLPNGRFWVGVTLCSPSDQFIKKIGRAKAIGRAYSALVLGATANGCINIEKDDKEWLKIVLQDEIDMAKQRLNPR